MNQIGIQHPRAVSPQQALRQLLAPALVFIVAGLDRQFQTDFWMHLARGSEIVATGHVLTADHYAIAAAGAPVRDANWLSQVIYSRIFSLGGLPLVQTLNGLTLAIALWLLVRLCHRNGASWRNAGAAGVITFLVAWQTYLIRPQTFSVLLFVLLYATLSRQNRNSTLIWPPLILLLWVNLHGGFLIGLALIAVFTFATVASTWLHNASTLHSSPVIVSQPLVPSALTLSVSLFLSAIATLINPYGWRIYQYAFSLAATVMPRHIEEWMPPPMNQWIGQALVGSSLLIAGLYFVRRRRPTLVQGLLLLCFLPLALHSARMVIWWAIIIAPIFASLLGSAQQRQEQTSRSGSWIGAAFCAVLVGLCVLSLPWLERINPIFGTLRSSHRTESDLDFIATAGLDGSSRQNGIIFAPMEWAQYLDWRLGPQQRLFVDGHVELASNQAWREYCQVISGDSRWESILDRDNVAFLLVNQTYRSPLLTFVRSSSEWVQTASSGCAILFARRKTSMAHDAGTDYPIKNPVQFAARQKDGDDTPLSPPPGGIRQFYGR